MEELLKILRSKTLLGVLGILVVVIFILIIFDSDRRKVNKILEQGVQQNKENQFGPQPIKSLSQSEINENTKVFIAQRDIALSLGYTDEAEKYNQIAYMSLNKNSPPELLTNINNWQITENGTTEEKKQAFSKTLEGLSKKQLNTIAQDYINIASIDFERGELNEMEKYLFLLSNLPDKELYFDIRMQIKKIRQAIEEEKNGLSKKKEIHKSMPQPTIDTSQLELDKYSLLCITRAKHAMENKSFNEAEKWLFVAFCSLNLNSQPELRSEINSLGGALGSMRLHEAERQKKEDTK